MRNLILSALSAGLLFAAAPAAPADAAVSANINLSFGNTPRYYFARQPRTILIPDTRVYYVSGMDDYDMFQCDGMWYIDDGGYWYRAPSYRGPFVSVSYASVPTVIMNVPSAYAHQPYRPGMWRSTSRNYGGSAYYRGGSSDDRGTYGADQRWQDRQRSSQTWQRRQRSDRNWSRDDDRGDNDRDNDRDHGNGNNHGNRGNGHGHGRGHGRGHDKG